MFYLYHHQNADFDDVRQAIQRFFGPQCIVTIHDGDGCDLFDRVAGYYCAGTVSSPPGNTLATFAIRYVSDVTPDGHCLRHVVGVQFGLPGQWCHSDRDALTYQKMLDLLARRYPVP